MIEVNGLYKGYSAGGKNVLKDVSFHVEEGSIHGLIGKNGSGKTTIIKCLTGIYSPDAGEVRVMGQPVFDNPAIKEQVGYVADSNQMFSSYKVKTLAKMYEGMFTDFSKEEYARLRHMFQVDENKKIGQMSKGQQMKASFVLNMARNPKILILDEPTSGLDAIAKRDLLDELLSAVEMKGMTVLISSHHLSELEKICDVVTMIRDGRVEINADIDGVTRQVAKYQVVFGEDMPKELFEHDEVLHYSHVGSVYTVVVNCSDGTFAEDMKALGASLVEELPVGLEESFVYMNKYEGGEEDA
ncbi:MAG: ABC transporter ATP-binding protein [Eubacterium sp.]|nr:ABC transporter ATP-binding protein [Eubacterium sp.]